MRPSRQRLAASRRAPAFQNHGERPYPPLGMTFGKSGARLLFIRIRARRNSPRRAGGTTRAQVACGPAHFGRTPDPASAAPVPALNRAAISPVILPLRTRLLLPGCTVNIGHHCSFPTMGGSLGVFGPPCCLRENRPEQGKSRDPGRSAPNKTAPHQDEKGFDWRIAGILISRLDFGSAKRRRIQLRPSTTAVRPDRIAPRALTSSLAAGALTALPLSSGLPGRRAAPRPRSRPSFPASEAPRRRRSSPPGGCPRTSRPGLSAPARNRPRR